MKTLKKASNLTILILAVFVLLLSLPPGTASAADSVKVSGSGGSVNIRVGPGTDYPLAATVARGTTLPFLTQQSGWYKVVLSSGKTGWIAGWLVAPVAVTRPETSAATFIIAQSVVNLREGPGTGYAIIGKTAPGQKLASVGKQGDWYKVSLSSGKVGWIAGWLVKTVVQKAEPQESPQASIYVVAPSVVNLREGPGTGYAIIGKTAQGQKLKSVGKQGDWYKVSLSGGKVGWIAGWLVKPAGQPGAKAIELFSEGDTVITDNLADLRSGPGADYPLSGRAQEGQRFTVLQKIGEWYRVRSASGQSGWLTGALVSRGAAEQIPPTTPPTEQFTPRSFAFPIRVALSLDTPAAACSVHGNYAFVNGLTGEIMFRPASGNVITIAPTAVPASTGEAVYAIQVEKDRVSCGSFTGPLVLMEGRNSTENWFELNANGISRRYRGNLSARFLDGKLLLVNELPFEEYLYGVVPSEMPSSWPLEALKAQAVAARSYALYAQKYGGGQFFDVQSTQASQVYRGLSGENPATTAAVDATKDLVAARGGLVVPAYFHSSDGGFTENSEDVWKNYVNSVRGQPDPYDRHPENPHYGWSITNSVYELCVNLQAKDYDFTLVSEINITERTSVGGRIKQVQIIGLSSDGAAKIETLKNADWVRSTFRLKAPPTDMSKTYDPATGALLAVTFTGNGWGHCLGMSQWGARTMADQGNGFATILSFYYNGAVVQSRANIYG